MTRDDWKLFLGRLTVSFTLTLAIILAIIKMGFIP